MGGGGSQREGSELKKKERDSRPRKISRLSHLNLVCEVDQKGVHIVCLWGTTYASEKYSTYVFTLSNSAPGLFFGVAT